MFVDHANREREIPGFTGYLADTPESLRIHHRIRYQVYCERKGYEAGAVAKGGGVERDNYDQHSLPIIVRDEGLAEWRSTVRLILRRNRRLPVESFDASRNLISAVPSCRVAEVSRLAALSEPVGRRGHSLALLRYTLGTMFAAASYFQVQTVVYMTTPGLCRMLDRVGIPMTRQAGPIEHKGTRNVYTSGVADSLAALSAAGVEATFLPYSRTARAVPVHATARTTVGAAPYHTGFADTPVRISRT